MSDQTIFGALEHISIPELGIKNILAKIDTGAYTGALHCEMIKEVKAADGTPVLEFQPVSNKHPKITVTDYHLVRVKSASGHSEERFIIPVTLVINGKSYPSHIGLTTRKGLRRQVLLGRRFLRHNHIIVDVTKDISDDKLESF